MKKVFIGTLVIAVIGLAFLVGSYKTSLDQQIKEKAELEIELWEQKYFKDEESKLDACLREAEKDGHSLWLKNCDHIGSNIEKDTTGEITDCSLPSVSADKINAGIQTEKDNCFRRYSK